jgi:hypothetical protein
VECRSNVGQELETVGRIQKKNGDCNVPSRYKQDPLLADWVNTQRQTKGSLSDEQRAKLDDLDFAWANELFEDQWDKMFQCLQRYAEENEGDCNIPGGAKENSANYELYLWQKNSEKGILFFPRNVLPSLIILV